MAPETTTLFSVVRAITAPAKLAPTRFTPVRFAPAKGRTYFVAPRGQACGATLTLEMTDFVLQAYMVAWVDAAPADAPANPTEDKVKAATATEVRFFKLVARTD